MSHKGSYFIIALLVGLLLSLAFIAADSSGGPDTSARSLDDIKAEVESKLDLGDPHIADTAMTMAADYPGVYNINQVSEIYNSLAQGGWFYFSDPTGSESYQNANLSLQRGKIKNTIGMGDCDDFAILMTSLIQSIGGSARVIFAYDIDNQMGHAYSELYLGENGTNEVDEILSWLKREYGVKDLPGINKTGDEIWLNLDWGSDITKAAYPGGPYFGEGSKNVIREIMWQPDKMVPPTIVPMIDSMDSTEGWRTLNDSKGSTAKIDSIPGKKANATRLSYDLKEGGWIGISKEIDPYNLSSVAGLNFSYFMMEKQNTIEMRLLYDDGTSFGASWSSLKTNSWQSQKMLYADLKCLDFGNNCDLNKAFNASKVWRIKFIISNNPNAGDKTGQGIVIIDEIRGLMAIPKGSAWAQAEEQIEIAAAINLAAQSEEFLKNPAKLIESITFSVESLYHHETFEGDLALRRGLALLPSCKAQLQHNGSVNYVAFSPDGKKLATASNDNTARIWDVATGAELHRLEHDDDLWAVAFSPDGFKLATASNDNTARIWDVANGTELHRLKHNGGVRFVAFSPDGQIVATASGDNTARLWDVKTGKELHELRHGDLVSSVIFSPGGRKVATASWDRTARIWDVQSGDELEELNHNGSVWAVAFSPDGLDLATASDDTPRIWDVETRAELQRPKFDISGDSVTFSPDGDKVATANSDNTARIWDVKTGAVLLSLEHDSSVNSVTFSPDGVKVATASSDNTARIWDVTSGEELQRLEHDGGVRSVSFASNGFNVATASSDNTARIWDATADRNCIVLEYNDPVYSVVFSPDGSKLATASGYQCCIWDVTTKEELHRFKYNNYVNSAVFSPDGLKLGVASGHQSQILDVETGAEMKTFNHEDIVDSIAFSPDGKKVATVSEDNNVSIWDAETGVELYNLKHNGTILSIVFSPDGHKMASAEGYQARIWDANTGAELNRLEHNGCVYSVAFSSDGSKLATASEDHSARIWNLETGAELARLKFDRPVYSVAFSPDSLKLATAGADNNAQIWDIATRAELQRLEHNDDVESVAFSPDGLRLATASGHKARIWMLRCQDLVCEACSRLKCNLTSDQWLQQYCSKCFDSAA